MLHGKGVHPVEDLSRTSTPLLAAELTRLREALLRITNLSGGRSIDDAKRIALNALDLEPQAPPDEKREACGSDRS